jgi:hypothetical protein
MVWLALSSTERRDLQPRAHLRSAPPPTLPSNTPTEPQLLLDSAVLDRLGALAIYRRPEKRWFKIPIHSDRVDDERGCDACARAMVSICSIPNDLSGDNKLEGCGESAPLSEVSHA